MILSFIDEWYAELSTSMVEEQSGPTKALLQNLEVCAVDETNWLRRQERGDTVGDLDVSSYNDACYWDFWKLIREPMWSNIGLAMRDCQHSKILIRNQAVAKDTQEK